MKHTLFIALAFALIGCSGDDDNNNCQGNSADINADYDTQVQWIMDHPGPNGVDQDQIDLLNQEREEKLSNACN